MSPEIRIAFYALIFGFVLCGFVVLANAQGFPPPNTPICMPKPQMLAFVRASWGEWPELHLFDTGKETIITRAENGSWSRIVVEKNGRACIAEGGLRSRRDVGI